MGYSFYVCKKCGEVNSESDGGAHQIKCTRKPMSKENRKKLEKAIIDEFGDDYFISERHLCYFDSFWKAFDFWEKYKEDETKKDECQQKADYVKLFLWHGQYGETKSLDEWKGPKQTEEDIKTAKKIRMTLR